MLTTLITCFKFKFYNKVFINIYVYNNEYYKNIIYYNIPNSNAQQSGFPICFGVSTLSGTSVFSGSSVSSGASVSSGSSGSAVGVGGALVGEYEL